MTTKQPASMPVGHLEGSERRAQSVTSDWTLLRDCINGVAVKEIRSVYKRDGYVTEIYRTDWALDDRPVDQVFQVVLEPGAINAWHMHESTTDRFFAATGRVAVVLYDARPRSPTLGMVNELRIGIERPTLVSVPPGVWHGVQNIGVTPTVLLNLVDKAYIYEAPDHWDLPADTDKIPYHFQ